MPVVRTCVPLFPSDPLRLQNTPGKNRAHENCGWSHELNEDDANETCTARKLLNPRPSFDGCGTSLSVSLSLSLSLPLSLSLSLHSASS